MKKHDEGYILAYVLIILTVICLIAVSALTVPVTNLRIQKAAVEEMRQQYAAQGMIEQAMTELRNDMPSIQMASGSVKLEDAKSNVEKCQLSSRGILYVSSEARAWELEEIPGDGLYVTSPISWSEKDGMHSCSFSLTAVSGSEMITVGVKLQNVINGSTIQTPQIEPYSYSVCTFTAPAADGQEGGGVNAP